MLWTALTSLALASVPTLDPIEPVHLEHSIEALPAMAPTSHLVPSEGEHHVTVYGYIPNWIDRPLDVDFDSMTHVAWFDVGLDTDGNVTNTSSWESIAEDLVARAHEHGTKVHLCVTVFDDTTHRAILNDPSKRANAVAGLASLVEEYGADGINIDFEGLQRDLKEQFVVFTREMSDAVDELFVATPLWDGDGSYDFDELAAASDGLFIMGYDAHTDGSSPGPVGPYEPGDLWPSEFNLTWSLDDYRTWGTPDDKIIMGLPLYGREWPATSDSIPAPYMGDASPLSLVDVLDRAASFDYRYEEYSQSAWAFTGDSQIWYDDLDSLRFKMEWALGEDIQGIGFWAVGYEAGDPEFWDIVDELTMSVPIPEEDSDTGLGGTTGTDDGVGTASGGTDGASADGVGTDGGSGDGVTDGGSTDGGFTDGDGGSAGGGEATDGSDDEEESSEDEGTPLDPPGPTAEYRDKNESDEKGAEMGCGCATTAIDTNHIGSWLLLGVLVGLRRRQSQN